MKYIFCVGLNATYYKAVTYIVMKGSVCNNVHIAFDIWLVFLLLLFLLCFLGLSWSQSRYLFVGAYILKDSASLCSV